MREAVKKQPKEIKDPYFYGLNSPNNVTGWTLPQNDIQHSRGPGLRTSVLSKISMSKLASKEHP